MIRPRADNITASASRKGVGRKILCECKLLETLCAESHISAATPARRRRAGLFVRRQAEAIVTTSTSHDRDRSSAFLVANFSGAGTSSSPQASDRVDGACCASLCPPSGYLPPSTASWRNRSAGKCPQNGRTSIGPLRRRCHAPLTGAQHRAGASFALCYQRGTGRSCSSQSQLAGQARRLRLAQERRGCWTARGRVYSALPAIATARLSPGS
jgi:hypothetical protein